MSAAGNPKGRAAVRPEPDAAMRAQAACVAPRAEFVARTEDLLRAVTVRRSRRTVAAKGVLAAGAVAVAVAVAIGGIGTAPPAVVAPAFDATAPSVAVAASPARAMTPTPAATMRYPTCDAPARPEREVARVLAAGNAPSPAPEATPAPPDRAVAETGAFAALYGVLDCAGYGSDPQLWSLLTDRMLRASLTLTDDGRIAPTPAWSTTFGALRADRPRDHGMSLTPRGEGRAEGRAQFAGPSGAFQLRMAFVWEDDRWLLDAVERIDLSATPPVGAEGCRVTPRSPADTLRAIEQHTGVPIDSTPAGGAAPPPPSLATPTAAAEAGRADPQRLSALAAAFGTLLACSNHGAPAQQWALMTDDLVAASVAPVTYDGVSEPYPAKVRLTSGPLSEGYPPPQIVRMRVGGDRGEVIAQFFFAVGPSPRTTRFVFVEVDGRWLLDEIDRDPPDDAPQADD